MANGIAAPTGQGGTARPLGQMTGMRPMNTNTAQAPSRIIRPMGQGGRVRNVLRNMRKMSR